MKYKIEIFQLERGRGVWVDCEVDHLPARFDTREEAEAEARFSFCNSDEWRVVEAEAAEVPT